MKHNIIIDGPKKRGKFMGMFGKQEPEKQYVMMGNQQSSFSAIVNVLAVVGAIAIYETVIKPMTGR